MPTKVKIIRDKKGYFKIMNFGAVGVWDMSFIPYFKDEQYVFLPASLEDLKMEIKSFVKENEYYKNIKNPNKKFEESSNLLSDIFFRNSFIKNDKSIGLNFKSLEKDLNSIQSKSIKNLIEKL